MTSGKTLSYRSPKIVFDLIPFLKSCFLGFLPSFPDFDFNRNSHFPPAIVRLIHHPGRLIKMEVITHPTPRTVDEVFTDFRGRRAGLIKALTTGQFLSSLSLCLCSLLLCPIRACFVFSDKPVPAN